MKTSIVCIYTKVWKIYLIKEETRVSARVYVHVNVEVGVCLRVQDKTHTDYTYILYKDKLSFTFQFITSLNKSYKSVYKMKLIQV